jgi:hypothetical protein
MTCSARPSNNGRAVRAVAVDQENVLLRGALDTFTDGGALPLAVAALRLDDHPRAGLLGDLAGVVCRVPVDHEHVLEPRVSERPDHVPDGFGLVVGRDEHADVVAAGHTPISTAVPQNTVGLPRLSRRLSAAPISTHSTGGAALRREPLREFCDRFGVLVRDVPRLSRVVLQVEE